MRWVFCLNSCYPFLHSCDFCGASPPLSCSPQQPESNSSTSEPLSIPPSEQSSNCSCYNYVFCIAVPEFNCLSSCFGGQMPLLWVTFTWYPTNYYDTAWECSLSHSDVLLGPTTHSLWYHWSGAWRFYQQPRSSAVTTSSLTMQG